jgi:hypothetical protein
MDPWRAWVLERLDAEIAQLKWEIHIGWTGEPCHGPRVENQPPPARKELPREVVERYLVAYSPRWRSSV